MATGENNTPVRLQKKLLYFQYSIYLICQALFIGVLWVVDTSGFWKQIVCTKYFVTKNVIYELNVTFSEAVNFVWR